MSRVLVIGDTHCPGMLSGYVDLLRDTYRQWRCDKVVHIGDLVSLDGICYHEKDPRLPSIRDEVDRAKKQVQLITKAFPKCDFLIGNHDALIERKMVTAGLSADWLRPLNDVLDLPKTWRVYPRYFKLKIDKVIYQHGDQGKGGQYSAVKNSKEQFASVVQGHHHAQAGVWWTANEDHRVFSMQTGCGMDRKLLQFQYGVQFASKPIISCGVVIDGIYAYVEPMIL